MKKIVFPLLAVLMILSSGAIVLAQDVLPTINYRGHEIEVEPDKGPVQVCIVKTVTTETLDETTVSAQGIIIAHSAGEWIVTGVFDSDVTGQDVGNNVGDCGSIQWEN
jgi:hypothetical protein